MKTYTIEIRGEMFVLHPSGALYWPSREMLLISDVHLGKVAHFRKHGVALPQHSAEKNFEQLDAVCKDFEPDTIVFLGDLFHSKINNEWRDFENWVARTDAKMVLIAGNHDVIDPRHYDALGIEIFSEWETDGFLLTHHPEQREGLYNFSGHIHPGILLRGTGRQSLKLPCFFCKQEQMIFPAFGQFTGKYYLEPEEGDCVYALTHDAVLMVCGPSDEN